MDALRGFALFGVIIMHMLQNFGYRSGGAQQEMLRFPALDEVIQWIGNNIIMGRFINIFAFLFGMSFFIQMDRAAKKGVDFRGRFVWRMIILMAMGLLCHSFYNLEIISVYAFFGLLLIPLFNAKNWMLIVIFFFFLLGGPRAVKVIDHNYTTAIELASIEDQTSTDDQANTEQQSNDFQRPRELPEHIKNPSFLNSARNNYETRLTGKLNYQFGLIGRGYITFSLFVLGLFVGRNRFFEKLDEQKRQNSSTVRSNERYKAKYYLLEEKFSRLEGFNLVFYLFDKEKFNPWNQRWNNIYRGNNINQLKNFFNEGEMFSDNFSHFALHALIV